MEVDSGSSSQSTSSGWSAASVVCITVSTGVLVANIVVLSGVMRKHFQHAYDFYPLNSVDLFVINMAMFDSLYCFGTTCALSISGGDLHRSSAARQVSVFFAFCGSIGSLTTLFGLAFTRYKLVFNPHSPRYGRKNTRAVITILWIVLIAVSMWLAIGGDFLSAPSGLVSRFGKGTSGAIPNLFARLAILGPTVGVFWLYRQIVKEIKSGIVDDAFTKNVVRMLFLMNTFTFVTLLPYNVIAIYAVVGGTNYPKTLDTSLYLLSYVNLVANPVFYCLCQRKYRVAVMDFPGFRYLDSRFEILAESRSRSSKRVASTVNTASGGGSFAGGAASCTSSGVGGGKSTTATQVRALTQLFACEVDEEEGEVREMKAKRVSASLSDVDEMESEPSSTSTTTSNELSSKMDAELPSTSTATTLEPPSRGNQRPEASTTNSRALPSRRNDVSELSSISVECTISDAVSNATIV